GLEKGILVFASAAGVSAGCLEDLLAVVDPAARGHLARHPWYAPREADAFPLSVARDSIGPTANGLRAACRASSVEILTLAARVTPEGRYNDLVTQTRNKASALFSLAA